MPKYLLDTGIVIRHLRGRKPIVNLVRGLNRTSRLAVATMTHMEVYAGMRPQEEYTTRKFLSRFVNLPLDTDIAERAGNLIKQRRREQRPIAVPDAIVAATAFRHQLTLVTLNHRNFENIPSLNLHPLDV
ncbi:MAG: type II toxin-antitoxin system VapC family toxin [Chloroflexi bacterium]|nr:type II toxin-antitoxin system VapC family toxin [Chloroflexota bacterium]